MNPAPQELFFAAVAKDTPTEVYRLIRVHKLEAHVVRDAKGHSALHVALLNNNTEVVSMLISHVHAS
jgi:hypothetical protein